MTARTAASTPPWTTPANVAGGCAAVCALILLACVRGAWAAALGVLLLDGAITLAWLAGATGLGLALLRASRTRFESLSMQITSAAGLGLGVESLVVLGLGLPGALNRVGSVAIVGAGLALLLWMIPSLVPRGRGAEQVSRGSWLWVLAMPALGIVLASAPLPPGLLWGADEPNGYDVVEYHLQVPREWYESGRIAPLRHNVFSHFPLGVEMHYLLAMHLRGGPWAGMYVAHLMHVGFVALSVLAVYGVLRELGARHAVTGAIAVATTPWMILLAPIGYNEGGLLLYGALALGLMLVAVRSPTPLRVAALAGAMAGLACGAKLTAVPMVLLAVPVVLMVCAFLPPPPGEGWGEGSLDREGRSPRNPPSPQPSPGGGGGRRRALAAARRRRRS